MPVGGRQRQLSYVAKPRLLNMRSLHHSKPSASSASQPSSSDRRRYKPRKVTGAGRFDQLKKGAVPDYTDFAYKEAVGKLKSMLNDSYTPSSKYHHHQVKADDSDDESGVSFLMSDTTRVARLGAYRRPIPKSYMASKMSPTAHEAPPAPANSAPPELLSFIERQEEYIEQLEKESQYCRDELSQLLGKVKDLISENESLHAQQKTAGYKISDGFDDKHSDISNFQFESRSPYKTHLEGPAIVFESRISELEAQLTQVRMDLKKSQEEAITYKRKLVENDPTSSNSDFYRQIEALHREKRELSDSLNKLQSAVATMREKESDTSRKVLRTQDVAEKAQLDRQQAEMEVQRLKSELDHQHQRLLDVLSEQTRKVAEERSQAERRYLQHVEQLSSELTVQRDTATKLQLELERHLRVEDDLRRDLSAKNQTADNVRKELNAKIASLQSELASALTERDSLEQELSTNRMSGERSERVSKQEASRLQVEVNALRQRIDRNDAELIQARRDNLRLSEQISIQESEIALYKSRLGDMDESGAQKASTVRELEGVVEKQSQAMNLLTQQCQSLTHKLDDASARHKQEMDELQSRLEFLTTRLDTSISSRQWPNDNYQQPVEPYQESNNYDIQNVAEDLYQNSPYPIVEETASVPQPQVFEDISVPPSEPFREVKAAENKPVLSRANSRGSRSESPLVRKDSRKSPITRRESRMQMETADFSPKTPLQQPLQQPQQPQRSSFSPESNYKNPPETAPYMPEPDSYKQDPIAYEPDRHQMPDYGSSYPVQAPYSGQDQYLPEEQAPYEQSSNFYPPDPTHYSPAPEPGGNFEYGEQYDQQSGAAPFYQTPDTYQPEHDRTPSRESLRKPYQENSPGYQPDPSQGYTQDANRTRKSSSNESTGGNLPNYQEPQDANPYYQQSSPEPQRQQPQVPATYAPDESRTAQKYQSKQHSRQPSTSESLSGSEQRPQDGNYEPPRPQVSAARREAVPKQKARNTPTKLQ